MIEFSILSDEAMDCFANKLYSVISAKKYYDDGSGGSTNISPFFYAEYMVMCYGKPKSKEKRMEVLQHPYYGKQTGYDYVVSMFKQHGGGNSMQQIASVQSRMQSVKGPVCGAANVKKITTTNRLASVFAFGAASSKISKQYECKTANTNGNH